MDQWTLICFTLLRGLHAVGRVFTCVLFPNKCPRFERFDPYATTPHDQKSLRALRDTNSPKGPQVQKDNKIEIYPFVDSSLRGR